MKKFTPLKTLVNAIFTLTLTSSCFAQNNFRIMSYNVENLMDTVDCPGKDDNEFLPDGDRRWTGRRYYHKLQQISKVITAAGEWDTPTLIGLCEVENDSVVNDLLRRTSLRKQDYRYIVTNSQDPRGINTALLYQRDKFRYITHKAHTIKFKDKNKKSRDILHVTGEIINRDTMDVFVCHFPSRYGGEKVSEQYRLDATQHLKALCDSLHKERTNCLILIMGDFNDTPKDKSMQVLLSWQENTLYCLFPDAKGSHKYRGEWSMIDNIIISQPLRQYLQPESAKIFSPDFILTKDKTWHGKRPLRTYHGFRYESGYSDHLPLIADFCF